MIVAERVYKSFDQPVLRGCSLTVNRGEIVGLMGPPASGKSVLLRSLVGLSPVDAGTITVFDHQVVGADGQTLRRVRQSTGMLFQNVALFDFMNVFENVAFPLRRMSRLSEAELTSRVESELNAVGLAALQSRMPAELSGGQRRRVGLARAAVIRPRLLLYDEPAAGLDPVTTSRAFSLIREQRRRLGSAIVVVSSDIDRLLPAVDRVCMMYQGRIVFSGSAADIAACPKRVVRQFVSGDGDG